MISAFGVEDSEISKRRDRGKGIAQGAGYGAVGGAAGGGVTSGLAGVGAVKALKRAEKAGAWKVGRGPKAALVAVPTAAGATFGGLGGGATGALGGAIVGAKKHSNG